MTTTTITRLQRRAILRSANETQKNIHIEIVPGIAMAPRTVGRSYYHTTPSGQPCPYPSAYRAHYGRPVYHASTRRVIVGEIWAVQAVQA